LQMLTAWIPLYCVSDVGLVPLPTCVNAQQNDDTY
jgi:hypothetical protein